MELGVNIDHIATLRNARASATPDIVECAGICLKTGAQYIVVHLRKDRRHIKDKDLELLCKKYRKHIHLECAATAEMEKIALKLRPGSVCIVPEMPGELTTQGGLKLTPAVIKNLKSMTAKLKKAKIKVSLFIDPSEKAVKTAAAIGADIVELSTKDYSEAKGERAQRARLAEVKEAASAAHKLGLEVHSGHGLDYKNVLDIAAIENMACLNIGFSIVAKSVYTGLQNAVKEMIDLTAV
ncbi:pyridoxine 5-phosphate synthase [Parelusimicrobium proximum]|uniref:pyridoxine 5'-phosphate synthase n=1 Tax=Parelusimicrobium proximum TaxID=3228953 RepID=UPI003D183934